MVKMMMRLRPSRWFGVPGALAIMLGIGAMPSSLHASEGDVRSSEALAESSCGSPGQPPCPLQSWMRAKVAAPLAANDKEALAKGLVKAAALSPDASWASWSTIAQSGAAAARKGDITGARAACKSCHSAWRAAYKEKYRPRPIPR